MRAGEVSDFASMFTLELVKTGYYWTFKKTSTLLNYSLKGSAYLNTLGRVTYAGDTPADVFIANGWAWDHDTGLLVPISGVTTQARCDQAGNYYLSDGLLKAGSVLQTNERLLSYSAWFTTDTMKFKYSEVAVAPL